uniref:Peptidase C1A papain C-terminal domain-containing protein n=1 Tax=Ditylum brightwellii TaxID=49249 RepID=A0A7S4V7Y0_9STRA|mmetsp:Transcript_30419/g.45910  ORF Transcript_30419/g.45910 Transcript_30419/m.45910 type:complete len:125 (+) Transcript_30419:881-1255(+)
MGAKVVCECFCSFLHIFVLNRVYAPISFIFGLISPSFIVLCSEMISMDNAFKYDETIKGLCSEEDYPYEAANKECRMDSCTAVPDTELKTYVDVDDQDAEALMAAVNIGPVSVAIQAGQVRFCC